MVKPAEHRDCADAARGAPFASNGLLLAKSLVRTRFVVEANVLANHAPQVSLVQNQDVVEQLPAKRPDETFSK